MIKLIATDLDGTLLTRSGLDPFTIETIKEAIDSGIEFVVATGRDRSSVLEVFEPHGILFSAILGNGAQYANKQGELLKEAYFNKALFKDVVAVLEEVDVNYMIFTTKGYFSTRDPIQVRDAFFLRGMTRFKRTAEELKERWNEKTLPCCNLVKIDDMDEFLNRDLEIIKIEAFNYIEDPIVKAKEKLKNINGISYLSSYPDNVEITDTYAQKGLILKQVIADLGIKEDEVAVFGDGLNDTTLFTSFSHSYAVANAVDEIKALAKYQIESNEDFGVAKAIKEIIRNNNL